jgi:hypothetical protein
MDVEEAFINHKTQFDDDNEKGEVSEATDDEEAGEHRIIVDPEDDYEQERQLNIKVKERLSQLGLSPRTLKNKRRALARDLEKNSYQNVPQSICLSALRQQAGQHHLIGLQLQVAVVVKEVEVEVLAVREKANLFDFLNSKLI